MNGHLSGSTLIDYMHAGLAPDEDARVHAHLEACSECRSEYNSELALSDALRAYGVASERELPSTLKAAIWNRIRAARPSTLQVITGWFRPAVALPVAAVLAAAAYFGTVYMGPQSAAPIDAAYFLQDHAALNTTVPFSDRAAASAADLETGAATRVNNAVAVSASYTADVRR